MKYIIIISLFLFSSLYADIPAGYYDSASGLSGESLKLALHNIIDDHTEFTYSSIATDTWDILKETDRDPDNADNVILLYTGWSVNAAQEYNNGQGWSREHVWPQSHGDFGTSRGVGTDVHHLRPCDISVNSARGNDDFDNGGTEYIDGDGPTGCYTTSLTWEPRDAVKGDVARMIFYMAVRYEGDSDEIDLELVDYIPSSPSGEPFHAKCSTLFQWHIDDPVDSWETNRNDIIYSDFQGNRNPFIDHPEYVTQIWNDDGTFLPVILSSFTVTFSGGNPLLSWSTQSESNNSHWNIFRSISQNLGQTIWLNESQIIQGQGSTSEPTDYTYIDVHPLVEFTTYFYWIESIDFSGETDLYGPVSLYIPAGGSNNGTPIAPKVYGLMQNYPNPFNPQTIVSFVFQEDTQAELSIFNLKGKFIKTLFQGISLADSIQYVSWNGEDFTGKQVSSGPYFYQLKTPTKTHTKKMLLLK